MDAVVKAAGTNVINIIRKGTVVTSTPWRRRGEWR